MAVVVVRIIYCGYHAKLNDAQPQPSSEFSITNFYSVNKIVLLKDFLTNALKSKMAYGLMMQPFKKDSKI